MKKFNFLLKTITERIEIEKYMKKYGICCGCSEFDGEGYCDSFELQRFPYKPRKKKCKYFIEHDDPDIIDIEDYLTENPNWCS